MGFGAGGGGFIGPMQSSTQINTASGLPFSGIPSEMAERAETILAEEPDHPPEEVDFQHAPPSERPLGLFSLLAPHRRRVLVVLSLVIAETLALQAGPLLTQIGIDSGVVAGRFDMLSITAGIYLFTVLGHVAAGRLRTTLGGRLGERLMHGLRVKVFSHLQRLSLDYYTRERAGVVMTRMTSDIEALTMLLQEGLVVMIVQALTLLTITGVLFYLNAPLAALAVVAVGPATLAASLWFRRVSEVSYGRVRDRIADLLSDLSENLAGIRVITATGRRRHNVVAHRNRIGHHELANVETSRVSTIYGSATEGVGILAQAAVLGVGGWFAADGRLSLGELTAFALYLTAFFAPIQQLVNLYNAYQQGQASVIKLRELLNTPVDVPEAPRAVELPPVSGRITFEDVRFGYTPEEPVLKGVSLEVPAGSSLSIVGETGAGKSTIAKLAIRFYDPDEGRVLIDGMDLRDVKLDSLRRQLGVVPQEPFLFADSIRSNITFARADTSEEEVLDACRKVGLDELIESLPDGLDTFCHERGASLSAGERQLLALTRALLAQPRVLILDEATSNLDLRSETLIERALDVLLKGRTAIIIAHRLATAMRAERIAVVDGGRIVEIGSHAELLAAGGRYKRMYDAWQAHAGRGSGGGDDGGGGDGTDGDDGDGGHDGSDGDDDGDGSDAESGRS